MSNITIILKFRGIDSWNRPVFRHEGKFYGSVNKLFSYDVKKEEVLSYFANRSQAELHAMIEYFGSHFNCEPSGNPIKESVNIVLEA